MSPNSKGTALGRHTSAVHVGAPSSDQLCGSVKTKVYFHAFADLPAVNGEYIESPLFYCLGYEWSLWLYPNGDEKEDVDKVCIFLGLCSSGSVEVEFDFSIKDKTMGLTIHKFEGGGDGFGSVFIKRETALSSYLTEGTLVVEVRIKPSLASSPFIPDHPLTNDTFKNLWFMDKEYADVVFEVATTEASDTGSCKSSTEEFFAHRNVLRKAAPQLSDMIVSNEKPAHVEISNMSPRTFRAILLSIYGLEIPELGKDLPHTKEIIEAADRFGLVYLKLEAEAIYVSSLTLTLENVMNNLAFADSKNCSVLKEAVIDFIINEKVNVIEKKVINDAPESLCNDILAALARKEKSSSAAEKGIANEFSAMCISELRRAAHTKGLDIDGSREALISALESIVEDVKVVEE